MGDQFLRSEVLSQDELNRLWQHGIHEERLFHDRLNYFSVVELGLLSAFAILYNKDHPFGLLAPLTFAALAFTLFWLVLQYHHWRYCSFLNLRMRDMLPEFKGTIEAYFGEKAVDTQQTAFAFSKPLSLAPPVIFALTWILFLVWVLVTAYRENRPLL